MLLAHLLHFFEEKSAAVQHHSHRRKHFLLVGGSGTAATAAALRGCGDAVAHAIALVVFRPRVQGCLEFEGAQR